jgi:hypothetical protein
MNGMNIYVARNGRYLYFYQTLQRHIPEVRNLYAHLGSRIKSCEST